MRFSLLALILSALTFTAAGKENIEGAFGLKFGDVFEPKTAPVSYYNSAAYEFEPEKPSSSFTKYVVFITPNTRRIFRIMAIGQGSDSETAVKRSKALGALLHQKYGDGVQRQGAPIVQGEKRQILVSVGENKSANEFRVIYQDTALQGQAVEEQQVTRRKFRSFRLWSHPRQP